MNSHTDTLQHSQILETELAFTHTQERTALADLAMEEVSLIKGEVVEELAKHIGLSLAAPHEHETAAEKALREEKEAVLAYMATIAGFPVHSIVSGIPFDQNGEVVGEANKEYIEKMYGIAANANGKTLAEVRYELVNLATAIPYNTLRSEHRTKGIEKFVVLPTGERVPRKVLDSQEVDIIRRAAQEVANEHKEDARFYGPLDPRQKAITALMQQQVEWCTQASKVRLLADTVQHPNR